MTKREGNVLFVSGLSPAWRQEGICVPVIVPDSDSVYSEVDDVPVSLSHKKRS